MTKSSFQPAKGGYTPAGIQHPRRHSRAGGDPVVEKRNLVPARSRNDI